jgi:hypothetical protein
LPSTFRFLLPSSVTNDIPLLSVVAVFVWLAVVVWLSVEVILAAFESKPFGSAFAKESLVQSKRFAAIGSKLFALSISCDVCTRRCVIYCATYSESSLDVLFSLQQLTCSSAESLPPISQDPAPFPLQSHSVLSVPHFPEQTHWASPSSYQT